MEENSNWVLEVEEALLDEAPPERIRVLLAGESHPGNFYSKYLGRPLPLSLRSDVWTHCLEISERKSRVEKFDDVYDHPEQSAIHQVFRGPLRGAFSTFFIKLLFSGRGKPCIRLKSPAAGRGRINLDCLLQE